MRSARGFTLIEVVVALVIFGIGWLGVAGMTVMASRTLREARLLEWAATVAGEVADSLASAGAADAGERVLAEGRVTWSVEPSGTTSHVLIVVHRSGPAAEPASPLLVTGAITSGVPAPIP